MNQEFLPYFDSKIIIADGNATFYSNDHELIVKAPVKLIKNLILLCDGKRTIKYIMEILGKEWDESLLRKFISELIQNNILINARDSYQRAWELVKNPIGYPLILNEKSKFQLVEKAIKRHKCEPSENMLQIQSTYYTDLLNKRKSIRAFDGSVPFEKIKNILWCAYGEIENGRRTVPSAGALYPLIIHIALFQQTDTLPAGIYKVNYGYPKLVELTFISNDLNSLSRSFLDPLILNGAYGLIIISGSFQITSEKYGSRSILFVPLEAGHVAQNINIAATELDVATVEIGGFKENKLKKALKLSETYVPLISTIIGLEKQDAENKFQSKQAEIRWLISSNNIYDPPVSFVSVRFSPKKSWSHGRDVSPRLALTKAFAETYEWTACGCIPKDLLIASYNELTNAIDPRLIVSFHYEQYKLKYFPFKPFDICRKYAWTKGYDIISQQYFYVLADHAYFPYFPETPYYCYANSSGVAAYPDNNGSIENSVLELVERDSFMIAYLTRVSFPTIIENSLPENIINRIKLLRKAGFKIWIKNHSIDLAPVIHVFVQSEEFKTTSCSSCSHFDIENALDHALMEVEAFVLSRIQGGTSISIKPHEVMWPEDHGILYDQKQYFHKADFLYKSESDMQFKSVGKNLAKSFQDLIHRIEKIFSTIITIPLDLNKKNSGNNNLHIIRSIIPGLVPMTFGYRQEPGGMNRIYTVAKKLGKKELSYQNLTKFPHPFA